MRFGIRPSGFLCFLFIIDVSKERIAFIFKGPAPKRRQTLALPLSVTFLKIWILSTNFAENIHLSQKITCHLSPHIASSEEQLRILLCWQRRHHSLLHRTVCTHGNRENKFDIRFERSGHLCDGEVTDRTLPNLLDPLRNLSSAEVTFLTALTW